MTASEIPEDVLHFLRTKENEGLAGLAVTALARAELARRKAPAVLLYESREAADARTMPIEYIRRDCEDE